MTDNRLKTALQYATAGIPVFPVREDKTPYINQWEQQATTDKTQIEKWFREICLGGCNFGAAIGRADIVVIDTDRHGKGDGEESLSALEAEGGFCFPETFTVHTPSGGVHRYYKASGYRSKNNLREALDVKSNGGYVVIAGSRTEKGEYTIYKGDLSTIADMPGEFLEKYGRRVTEKTKPGETVPGIEWDSPADIAKAREFLQTADPAIAGAGGYETTVKTIQYLGDLAISEEKALELLTEPDGWNDRSEPPWDVEDLQEKIASLYGGTRHKLLGCESMGYVAARLSESAPGTPPPFDFERFLNKAEYYLQMQNTELEYYIEGFLPVRYVTNLFYGSAGEGKTTVMYQMLQCIMTSTPFLGLKTQKRDARPLVVSMEEPGEDIANRLKAQQKGVSGDFGDLPIMNLFGQSVDFFTCESKTGKIACTQKWADFTEYVKKQGYNLVVIDNLGRLFPGDENNRVAVSTFGNILNQFCEEAKAQILIIAHNNKTGIYSGSSAWDAIARNRYSWERKGDRDEGFKCRLSVTKSNYIPKGAIAYARENACRLFEPISKAEYEAADKKDTVTNEYIEAVKAFFNKNGNNWAKFSDIVGEIDDSLKELNRNERLKMIQELCVMNILCSMEIKQRNGNPGLLYRLASGD